MRTGEYRRSHLVWLSKLALLLVLGLSGSAIAQKGDEETWEEKASGGSKAKPAPPPAPKPAPPPPPQPAPPPPPKPAPPPPPKPTPNAKDFKTADEYACKKVGTGDKIDPVTKETEADKARREWESTQTDRKTKGGRPVPPPYSMPPYPPGATPYMKQCIDAGVPVPPTWGDDRWVKQGNLPPDKTFASSAPTTEVWTYRSAEPPGICYALPRIDGKPPTIQLLGQICQGAKSGKACFWDNLDPKNPKVDGRTPVTNNSGPTNMAGADIMDLPEGEQCTNCHRGDNVFNIHPGTPLQRRPTDPCSTDGPFDFPVDDKPTDTAKKPYEPIVGPKFTTPKNEEIKPPLTNGACASCHSIPTLTSGYCGILLRALDGRPASPGPPPVRALSATMPPPDGKRPPDASGTPSPFQQSADELKARCAALP